MTEIQIKWDEVDQFVAVFKKAKKGRMADIVQGMRDSMLLLDSETQKHLRGGNPLFRGTGKLASHVKGSPVKVISKGDGKEYQAEFGVIGDRTTKGPGFYGRVLEWGAQTPGHIVKPKKPGGFLVFRSRWKMKKMKGSAIGLGGGYGVARAIKHGQGTGHLIFAKKVKMSPKPWLTPSFHKRREGMVRILTKAGAKIVDDLVKK
jgi:hypothetical protein